MEIERRPDRDGRNTIARSANPAEWEARFGKMPTGGKARRDYILRAIEDGRERRAKGEHVPWLDEREIRA